MVVTIMLLTMMVVVGKDNDGNNDIAYNNEGGW